MLKLEQSKEKDDRIVKSRNKEEEKNQDCVCEEVNKIKRADSEPKVRTLRKRKKSCTDLLISKWSLKYK